MNDHWRPSLALIVTGAVGLLVALPILGMAAVVVFSREPADLLESLADNAGKIALAVVIVLGAATAVGYAFWRGLTRPLGRLNAQAERVAAGGRAFDVRGPFGTRELARLGGSFARTVEALQRRARTIETFSTHLAHELKSPLTGIRGAAELLRDEGDAMTAAQRERFLANITADAERLTALVARLRDLARADMDTGPGEADVAEIARQVAQRVGKQNGLDVRIDVPPGTRVPLSPDNLAIVLGHLLDNAAAHGAGEARIAWAPTADGHALLVQNDGAPIPRGDVARVAEPFFTTRRESGGTGMGLAIVSALLAPAGGRIELESPAPVRFAIRFGRQSS